MIVFSRPRFAHGVLRSLFSIGLLAYCLFVGDTLQSAAQTAHFGGSAKLLQAMNYPQGIALDAAGNLFVLTVPGTGGGVATQVTEIAADGTVVPAINLGGYTLTSAVGLALDSSGYLYIVDNLENGSNTSRVLKMKTDGSSASVVPTGPLISPGNVAVDGSGNVYVEDNITETTSRIVKVPCNTAPCTGGTYHPEFDFVSSTESIGSGGVPQYIDAIAVDASGNLLFTDINPSNARLIKVAPSGIPTELIPYTTSIGTGGTLFLPYGVQADAQGNIFITDFDSAYQGRLVELPYSAGGYGTPFEYVTPNSGILSYPVSLAIDANGNLYAGDSENDALTSNADGGLIEISTASISFGKVPVATTAPPTSTVNFTFDTAGAIGTPTVKTQGTLDKDFTDAGTGTCTTTNGAGHSYATGSTCTVNVTFNPKVSGTRYGAVTLLNTSGTAIATAYVYGSGQAPQMTYNQSSNPSVTNLLGGGWAGPQGVAVDGSGNVFVADTATVKEAPVGCASPSCVVPLASSFSFGNLPGLAVDGGGNVFVADYGNSAIYEIVAAGGYTKVNTLGGNFSFSSPTGVAVDGSGNVYVADYQNNAVEEILASGGYTTVSTLGGGFSAPQDVAVDGKGNVYVADTGNSAVKLIPPGCGVVGCVVTLGGGFNAPAGVAVDGNGNIYIGDTNNNAVKQMPASCLSQSCVATLGSGFGLPQGVALDGNGNVYVADSGNGVVKEMDFADPAPLSFTTSTFTGSLDTTDGAKTVTLSNIGNQQLTFTSPASGSNPSYPGNFPKNSADTNLCAVGTPLAVGASCDISANFQPMGVGSNTGSVMLTDDALNVMSLGVGSAIQSISLSGVGLQADATSVMTTVSSNAIVNSQQVTLMATVSDTTNTSDIPTGTVTFTDTVGSTPTTLGPATMTNGVATYTYTPTAGTHTITSSYTPTASSSFVASNDATGTTLAVAAYGAVASLSVTATGNSVYTGAAVPLTVMELDSYGNTIANYTGPVTLSSTDPGAAFSAITFINGVGTGTVTFATAGAQTVTATAGALMRISGTVTVQPPPTFMVTATTDTTTGTAGNCTNQSRSGATPDASCSLRDAIAAANTVNGATTVTISFESGLVSPSSPGTITLANGQIELSDTSLASLVITGPGANALSISGNHASRIFSIDSGVKAVVSGLALTNGTTSDVNGGGAIYVLGNLTLNNEVFSSNASPSGINGGAIAVGNNAKLTANECTFTNNSSAANGGAININNTAVVTVIDSTFSGNMAAVSGGAIGTAGTLQITNSTFTGNTATTVRGGAIYNTQNAALTLTHTTVVGNTSATFGGAVYVNSGSVTLKNSLVIGNSSGSYPDIYQSYVDDGGNIANDGSGASMSSASLSSLSNYGGSTQTMVPLPGSPAICAGTSANASGISDDQRGLPRTTTYGSTSCVDAGAVQSNYSLSFTTAPGPISPAATIAPGANFQAAVTLEESGAPFVPAVSVPLTLTGSGTLTNGTASTTNGVVSYSTLQVSASGVGDTLTANLALNGALVPPLAISAVSSSFTVEQLTASTVVASSTLTQNHAAVSFTPVTESGGTAPITYSVSPTLPMGLSMAASTGAITGTPTVTSSATSYTVTATDSNGAMGTANFSLTVDSAVTATQAVASATLTQNHASTLTPVTATGGVGTLSYSVSPALPAGLSMSGAGIITGTPTATSNATTYTVTVTDSNGATGTANFSLTVDSAVTATQAVASATLTQNHASTLTPVTATGGVGTLSYSVSPALPAGLSMSGAGIITGTPTVTSNATTYTVTVTDSNGATGTATFVLAVDSAVAATQAVASTTVTVNTAAAAFTPITGSGGTSPLSYSVAPTLPAGLALASGTGTITGTPTIVTPAATYTVTVTDSNGATATASFSLTVGAETATIEFSVLNHTYGDAPFSVNATSPSSGAFTYSVLSGPATISGSTVTLTGIGMVQIQVSEAADADYAAATGTASFTVAAEVPTLSFGTIASQTYGNAPFSVSAISASSGAVTYAVVSGPATISGHTVTPTGAGTIVLSATQAADGNYTSATATTSVAVNRTAPAVMLSSTRNPVLVTNSVTLTATVSSGISVPTGTVSFYDGTSNAALGTSPVTAGVATLSISSLAVGVHSITAVYSGDANFVTLTSSAVSETVQDFSLVLSTSTGSTTSQTVAPGATASYALMVSPLNGTVFPAIVSFTASGLPPGATAIFTPQTLPAGSGLTPVTLSIQTPAPTARLERDHRFGGGFVPVALGVLLLPFSTCLRRSARKLGRAGSFAALLLLLLGGLAGIAGLTGCGTSNGFLGQSPKNYTITVTATSGTLQHTSTVILNLQ